MERRTVWLNNAVDARDTLKADMVREKQLGSKTLSLGTLSVGRTKLSSPAIKADDQALVRAVCESRDRQGHPFKDTQLFSSVQAISDASAGCVLRVSKAA